MSNDHRRSEQPVGEPMGEIAKQYKKMFLKRAANTSSVEQRIDELIKELTGKSSRIPKNYRAKQQLISLIEEVIGEDESTEMETEVGGYDNYIRNELRAEQRAQIKGVNHE